MQQMRIFFFGTLILGVLLVIGNTVVEAKKRQPGHETQDKQAPTFYLYAAEIVTPPEQEEDEDQQPISKKIRIINLGPIVNSPYLEYAPAISVDGKTLYFVSNRPGSIPNPDGEPSHDFWAATKENRYDTVFHKPFNIDPNSPYGEFGLNTWRNEGVMAITADQQMIFFTACDRPDGLGSCDIYVAEIQGDKWGKPKNLGPNVNTEHWESQPTITSDKSRLYFASNRPGGQGGIDIWYSDYDFEFDEWKPAKNLGPVINTPGMDWSPFIAADDRTLFFSSNGHEPNLGGLDFYYSRLDDQGNWSKPVNLGPPINTEEDEAFISLPGSGDIIYFASKREDLPGFQGDFDIFMAFVPTYFRTVNLGVQVKDECTGADIPAKVSIFNPVTNRTVEDSVDGERRKQVELVIRDQDFGPREDSIQRIGLVITAFNPRYGKTVDTVYVDRPKAVEDEEKAKQAIDLPPAVLYLGQRPRLEAEMDFADYIKRTGGTFKGLVMEEVVVRSLHPLLNYVFFDLGSAKIPDRYILFKSPEETRDFTDETIPGGTLEKYYHILNIIGYRLKKHPKAKIEIVGCNDNTTPEEKKGGKKLSRARAEAVFNYLKNIWGISPDRMKIKVRNLPKVYSNLRDTAGIKENRRVEILSNDWEILKPILDVDKTRFPSPEEMTFFMDNGIEDALVAARKIVITRGDKPWNELTDIGTTEKSYVWNWQSREGTYPEDEVPFKAKLVVISKNNSTCESLPIYIKVKQVTTEEMLAQKVATKTLEKYNLILFPFDRYDPGPLNERILKEYIYPRIFPSSEIEIVGHTDVVGLYDHNKRLSENRAKAVAKAIRRFAKGKYKQLKVRGVGEDDPLYTNLLPEGRFYNRTVQIIIQTPLEDIQKAQQQQP